MNRKEQGRYYVTFHIATPEGRSEHRSIECPDITSMYECARSLKTMDKVRNIRTSTCGNVSKNSTIYPFEDWKRKTYRFLKH